MNGKLDLHNTARQDSLLQKLGGHPFLRDFAPEHLATLIQFAVPTEFPPGQVIFHQGDMANCFYLILHGEIVLLANQNGGECMPVDRIGHDDVLGWSWLFPPYRWNFTARAIVRTKAVFFYGTWLRERCEEDPALGYELMKRMTGVIVRRLQKTRQRLVEFLPHASDQASK